MFKYILFLLCLIPLSMIKNIMIVLQILLFFIGFIFMFIGSYTNEWMNMGYMLSCDLISFGLIFLSIWICSLMILASQKIYKMLYNDKYFNMLIIILLLLLVLTFSSLNIFLFYLFFESSLIPVLFLILGWGYQSDRIQAGVYLLFYTLLASLPLLLGIIWIYNEDKSLILIMFNMFSLKLNLYFYFCVIMAFLVKMPMYLVHLWLPKAHVEAPVSGSMILAGIMLKLGGYGLLRIYILIINLGLKLNFIFVSISLIGGFIISLICLFQFDLKSLIAYSSVAHMGLVIGGIMTMSVWGFNGSFLMMISHGLCSSGLFCLANIMYERLNSRSLMINKGLINFMPSMSLWWFFLCSSNMSAPPSLNLLSEIMLLNSLISWNYYTMFFLILLSFFSALYTLYLYSYTQHGNIDISYYCFSQGLIREYLLLILHWLPLNFLILNSELFLLI